jgi:hypothetical protein
MLNELFHIPDLTAYGASGPKVVIRLFTFADFLGNVFATWQPYEIPRNHSMVFMVAMGGSGYGGNGFSAAAGNARGGGGGGGSGGIARFLCPRILLPDVVYILVGRGGVNATSTGGADTSIAVLPNTTEAGASSILSGRTGGNGSNGTGAAVGAAGGAAGSLAVAFNSLGLVMPGIGANGAAGGAVAGAVGTSVAWGGGGLSFSGGAGGGGTTSADFAGGNITGAGLFPTVNGGAAGSNNGGDGVTIWKPWMFSGGAGGGASNTGNGGNGGNGGPGCGGGGGGGGVVGGTGGNGGSGFALIVSW